MRKSKNSIFYFAINSMTVFLRGFVISVLSTDRKLYKLYGKYLINFSRNEYSFERD